MKILNTLAFTLFLAAFSSVHASFAQQGNKLVGTGAVGTAQEGFSAALSADGNTALIGGHNDNSGVGAAWIFMRSGGVWTQQGGKLLGTVAVGPAYQGYSVTLSADGNTAVIGGKNDSNYDGAARVFTRSGGVWTQQGGKLTGTGGVGTGYQGWSVSLSADGNTFLLGGPGDNGQLGAVWVFTRSGTVWAQQGGKLVGTGAAGNAAQGAAVSLSADGNSALIGGYTDSGSFGAAWVFTRTGGVWTQQGGKLLGTGAVGNPYLGRSVSLSTDGNTAVIGGSNDNSGAGAVWIFTRSGGVWTQQGAKLLGTGVVGAAQQGTSVSLSANGNTALIGGFADNSHAGAAWVFTRSGGVWTQSGSKLVGTGAVGTGSQGFSVSLSADGSTFLLGGFSDNAYLGAAWIFAVRPATHFSVTAPAAVTAGTSFSVTVTALDSIESAAPNYAGVAQFTSTDGAGALPLNYTFVAGDTGAHMSSVTLNSVGSRTVTATDAVTTTIMGTSANIIVNPPVTVGPATLPIGTLNEPGYNQTVTASGGTATLTLSQTGTLPTGLIFAAATGVISGTPTAVGMFNFTITATDSIGATGEMAYTLTIKATASVSLGNLTQTFDGTPKFATASTNPTNLPVLLSYDGSATAPTNVGAYAVVGTISDANFQGSATGTLNIVSASTTTIVSGPSASPNPTFALQPVAFSVAATNSGNASLTFTWAFGDGALGTGASVSHAYASPGTYTATVTLTSSALPVSGSIQVKINTGVSVIGPGPDSDGDGFSDTFENAVGSAPDDAESTPTGDPASDETLKLLTIAKAAIKLNFAKTGSDAIVFTGTLTIPAGFNREGAKVYLNAGGVIKSFTLNAKGSGATDTESVKIAIKSKKGVVATQTAKYIANFKKGSFAVALANAGLNNITVKAAPVMVPFTFIINNGLLQTTQTMSYTAKVGKSGAAK